ncbi:putative zinc ribbon protein [Amycolatopsis sulphurea]|uniref:Putative zinc ribbon protein n=1 Tax=Amycolatopsis sulphurea TaxID=76022 RepID=A0A2A9FGF3_9PSEU|nr:zinc-ribbon domain-containing protein [Amycolatopsis sulphurea]PFG50003.1 putative zinc ribbon protein [Amycolatopsis sulphurea]
MVRAAQECSTSTCSNPAAFSTRTKPAWCLDCIGELVDQAGLRADEPFPGLRAWWLTTCSTCGVQAHYRLEHVLNKIRSGEKACRACFLFHWRARQLDAPGEGVERAMCTLLEKYTPEQILEAAPTDEVRDFLASEWWSKERLAARLDTNNLDLVKLLDQVTTFDAVLVTKCRACGRLSVERISDTGWGCTCSRNTRSSHPAAPAVAKTFLNESGSPAVRWWDYERNDETTLRAVTVRATRNCHWVCPRCSHRFTAKVSEMTKTPWCPQCAKRDQDEWQETLARWKITPVAEVPQLLDMWADDASPSTVMVGDSTLRRFRCNMGHHPRIAPARLLDMGCPHCRGKKTASDKKWLADTLPEIAAQWHPTLNGKLAPQNVVWDSKRTVWWTAECCGHQWQESVRDRDKYQRLRCPSCRTILGSLAWENPELAGTWSPANPVSAWHVRPHAALSFTPEWICAGNPAHTWQMSLASRSTGAGCPECREAGKSRVELSHYQAAVDAFGQARSGAIVRLDGPPARSWTADIIVEVDGQPVVIEYDGSYWHTDKVEIDERKSHDLLAAGYLVVRLREDDLPSLSVDHPGYRELRVLSSAPRPTQVIEEIRTWLAVPLPDGDAPGPDR